ncbi:MAG: beta-lactamase family protein [Gemmataceae bacterium]|nr:beta-lactamase family protein [Gemmataceae bacterium]
MIRSVVVLLLVPALALGQPPRPTITLEALQEIVDGIVAKHKIPALGVAVVTSDGLYAGMLRGVRKAGTRIGVTEKDKWHLGSDTKAFTALLAAVLAEKKLIDLDQTLEAAFPSLAKKMQAPYRKATLDQLLRHKGGLKNHLTGGKGWWIVPTTLKPRAQRLDAVARGLALKPVADPGTKFSYSNLGYVVLAAAIEQKTGEEYAKLLEKHVLEPLGIKDAGYGPMNTLGKTDQPWQHDDKGRPRDSALVNDNPPVMSPSARLHMSLPSWALFAQEQLKGAKGKGKLLSAEGYKRLHAPAEGEGYAPGAWIVEKEGTLTFLTHDGGNGANFCRAVLVPQADVALLLVCNMAKPAGEKAIVEATKTIFPRLFAPK